MSSGYLFFLTDVIGGAVAGLVVIACISVAGIVGIWCCSSKTTNKSSGKSDTEDNNCRSEFICMYPQLVFYKINY